jgi:hypothetical protein
MEILATTLIITLMITALVVPVHEPKRLWRADARSHLQGKKDYENFVPEL